MVCRRLIYICECTFNSTIFAAASRNRARAKAVFASISAAGNGKVHEDEIRNILAVFTAVAGPTATYEAI